MAARVDDRTYEEYMVYDDASNVALVYDTGA